MVRSKLYDLDEEDRHRSSKTPQTRYHRLEKELKQRDGSLPHDQRLAFQHELLALAKLQREMYPVDAGATDTDPLLLVQAHLQLSKCYRAENYQHQALYHVKAALRSLKDKSSAIPASFSSLAQDAAEHKQAHQRRYKELRATAYKALGEIYMDEKPAKPHKALKAFIAAVPGLAATNPAQQEKELLTGRVQLQAEASDVDNGIDGSLPDDVADEVLADMPFAASLACCFGLLADDLLQKLDALMRQSEGQKVTLRESISEVVEMELAFAAQVTDVEDEDTAAPAAETSPATPAPVGQDGEHAIDTRINLDERTLDEILDALVAAEISRQAHPQDAKALKRLQRGTSMHMRAASSADAPGFMLKSRRTSTKGSGQGTSLSLMPAGAVEWLLLSPMQKLGQLCMRLALAKSASLKTLVVLATRESVVYLELLLKELENQDYFDFGRLYTFLADVSDRERAALLVKFGKRSDAVLLTTDAAIAGYDVTSYQQLIYYDVPHNIKALSTRVERSAHACSAIFLQPHEDLVPHIIRKHGVKLPRMPGTPLPVQFRDSDQDEGSKLEQVLRRKAFKSVRIQEAGAIACLTYVEWYKQSPMVFVFSTSCLWPQELQKTFCVPDAKTALSSIAHSFAKRNPDLAPVPTFNAFKPKQKQPEEEEMNPILLERLIVIFEKLGGGSETQASRQRATEKQEEVVSALTITRLDLQRLPRQAHELADRAITLLYCLVDQMEEAGNTSGQLDQQTLRKIWRRICEVQLVWGKVYLNDVNQPEQQRIRSCAQRLNEIILSRDNTEMAILSPALEQQVLQLCGWCRLKLKEYDKALHFFTQLKDLEARRFPQHPARSEVNVAEARAWRGHVLKSEGRYAEAGEEYSAALHTFTQHLPADHEVVEDLKTHMKQLLVIRRNELEKE